MKKKFSGFEVTFNQVKRELRVYGLSLYIYPHVSLEEVEDLENWSDMDLRNFMRRNECYRK